MVAKAMQHRDRRMHSKYRAILRNGNALNWRRARKDAEADLLDAVDRCGLRGEIEVGRFSGDGCRWE